MSLNTDTLLAIGSHLPQKACHNAIFVTRQWHELFLRSLYSSASLRNQSQLQCFLKAILVRPELGNVVKSLDFREWRFESSGELGEGDMDLFSTFAKECSSSNQEHVEWERDLSDGTDEAWIALLLSAVKNIRHLDLIYPAPTESKGYLDRLFEGATCPTNDRGMFHRLSQVSLRHMPKRQEEDRGAFCMRQIRPFLRMPLGKLSVDSLVEYEENTETDHEAAEGAKEEGEGMKNAITELNLRTSNGCTGLSSLLSSTPSLRSFKYQHSDAHCLSTGFKPSLFHQSLSQHKSTLSTLHLDQFGEHLPFTISGLNESHEEWFGPFVDFVALKELRVRMVNLLDVQYSFEPSMSLAEVLPVGIERLFIESCKEREVGMLVRQVRGVLESKKFKGLKVLEIEGFFHDDEEDADASGSGGGDGDGMGARGKVIKEGVYEMVQPLREVCEAANVQLFLRDRACPLTMLA